MTITRETKEEEIVELGKIECGDCDHCCRFGGGYLLPGEIKEISKNLKLSEDEFKKNHLEEAEKFNTKLFRFKSIKIKNNYGPCIFLENKKCAINEFKPLYCRIGTCSKDGEEIVKWFDLNFCVNANDPESVRQYASFLKSSNAIEGGKLGELIKDEKRLKEILSYEMLK
ncbi:MAG: YkgJ family cysteine cluster protein [Candidatus Woesearchaeota archaeon]|nr:YkgJ family cysteine cluster protein [Candidatus Woesearchaeota archaeon]